MSVSQSNRLQPSPDDYDPRYRAPSPPYRQPPARYNPAADSTVPLLRPYPDQSYRGPPSDAGDRRDYRDVAEYGRDGFLRGNGSLPRGDTAASLQHPAARPASAQPGQYPPYTSLSRPPAFTQPPPMQPQYSNGSYNPPAVMESPPRPGIIRAPDERLNQQTASANQQYERVSSVVR